MTKSILISIKPEHLINILNGKKTLELRKSVPKDYKGWVYIYCTKSGGQGLIHHQRVDLDFLGQYEEEEHYSLFDYRIQFDFFGRHLNGSVVARFWFDDFEIYSFGTNIYERYIHNSNEYDIPYNDLNKLELNYRNVVSYGNEKTLYAWHIKNLEIFDKPLALKNFYKHDNKWSIHYKMWERLNHDDLGKYVLIRPPQSYQFVYVKEDDIANI